MNRILALLLLIVLMGGLVMGSAPGVSAQTSTQPYRVVGYYAGYGIYQNAFVTDVDAAHLTHLNYAWIGVSSAGQCVSADLWTDTQFPYPGDDENLRLKGNFRQLQILRGDHPNLKILMTVGGWDNSTYFSEAASTAGSRERLVRSCVAFMRQYLFDGIDIDWRYPVSGGQVMGQPDDRANFTLLLAEFRRQLDAASVQDNRSYHLTMLAPSVDVLYQNFEIDQIHPYLDWINLMSFGFQGEWSEVASHQAPLYANSRDPRGEFVQQNYNVDAAVTVYLDAGVPSEKLVLGIPFYAQAWQNVRSNDYFGLYEPASGVPSGTRPGGILYYRDLTPLLSNSQYTNFFDEETGVPWLYSAQERIAISYENPRSIREKASYARQHRLGGVMLWQLNYDDVDSPLLNAAYTALYGE